MTARLVLVMLVSVASICGSDQVPAKVARPGRAAPVKSNLPKQLPKPVRHVPTAKRPSMEQPRAGSGRPVRSPVHTGPAAPLSNVRHLGGNPAVIAGSAKPVSRSAGTLDGRQVHRRP